MRKVAIVGGGIIGLYTGLNLIRSGFEVELFEEDPTIGEPQHCTGLVSDRTALKLCRLLGHDIIQNIVDTLYILSPPSFKVKLKAKRKVFIINRKRVEEKLADLFKNNGGVIYTDSPVLCIRGKELTYRLNSVCYKKTYDYIINAGGVKTAIRRVGSLNNFLPAYQLDIKLASKCDNIIEVIIDKRLNPFFFIWKVPVNKKCDLVRVGTASFHNPKKLLYKIIKSIHYEQVVNQYSGHIVLTGPIKPFYEDGIIYIGDAAGQTKLTTGGGIAYGLSATDYLCEALLNDDINIYEKKWTVKWSHEILLQKIFRRMFLVLNQKWISFLLKYLDQIGILNSLVTEGEIDTHMTSLLKVSIKAIKLP